MFKLVLLFLTVSGLQALPIADPRGLQKAPSTFQLPDGFQQDTDFHQPLPDGFRQGTEPSGLVEEDISEMDMEEVFDQLPLGNGYGEMERRHWLTEEIPDDVPVQRSAGGWVRVEEPAAPQLPDGFRQGTEPMMSIPDGFRQGTEPMMSIPDGLRQGTEPMMSIPEGFRQGTEPMMSIPDGFRQGTEPMMSIPDGFRQGTEPMMSIPDGFRQGTEPIMSIPDGFRQGTEPMMSIPDGLKQGTEPKMSIPEGFRQGTKLIMSLPEGFRQGTEPTMSKSDNPMLLDEPLRSIPAGFRQGTEPTFHIPEGFKQGTEPMMSIPDGFRQGTEPSASRIKEQIVTCKGEVINGKCYEFNPTPMAFEDAQFSCRSAAPNAELASISNSDLHARLVSLVTKGGETNPVLTWLGAMIENQQASWVDGTEWNYSDWMPGHPNIHTDKPACLEMFRIDESWWTAADCELKRASICSYSITA